MGEADDGRRDVYIGRVLFLLPFLVLVALFLSWPSPRDSESDRVKRDVFALKQTLADSITNLDAAIAERNKADKPTEQVVKDREAAAVFWDNEIKKTKAALQTARDKQAKASVVDAVSKTPWLSEEAGLCLLVVLSGALGASVSAARGFAVHHGNKDYDPAWRWWYLLRIPTGMVLAFVLYAVLRAGLVPWQLGDEKALDNVNPYGFIAIGALGGMFANETFQKLQDVLAVILTAGANAKVSTPKLTIQSVKLTTAGNRKAITITGDNFAAGATVKVNDVEWTVVAKDVTKTEVKATGKDDLPTDKVKIDLTVPGKPPQTATWNNVVEG